MPKRYLAGLILVFYTAVLGLLVLSDYILTLPPTSTAARRIGFLEGISGGAALILSGFYYRTTDRFRSLGLAFLICGTAVVLWTAFFALRWIGGA